jgi:hypothetical protein
MGLLHTPTDDDGDKGAISEIAFQTPDKASVRKMHSYLREAFPDFRAAIHWQSTIYKKRTFLSPPTGISICSGHTSHSKLDTAGTEY